jgi:serine/threonine-protein kinase
LDDTETLPYSGPVVAQRLPALERGDVVGARYVVEHLLGRGGSGQVFRTWDRVMKRAVALKLLPSDQTEGERALRRLVREVRLARRIRHPNVCSVFDLEYANQHWFITMEVANSATLCDELRAARSGEPDAREWRRREADVRALCAGLAAVHGAGVVHRDVKTQNVLRMADGRLVVADFGLALATGDETSSGGGTPNCLPPEVNLGMPSDQRSDVWQLGLVMHQILLHERPTWTSSAVLLPTLRLPSRALPRSIAAMLQVSAACLSWHNSARPADAREVCRLLGYSPPEE